MGSLVVVFSFAVIFSCFFSSISAWGTDGHYIVCQIAQERLNEVAADNVNKLLPNYAQNNLSRLCSWADHIRFIKSWSTELHYINVPDDSCTYNYSRDCKDENGVMGRCAAGAITNYTSQLLTYGNSSDNGQYNLTQALLFLSHIMGDIHQPLHVGHTSDEGGNTIHVQWFTEETVLHHVWDSGIIGTAEADFYGSDVSSYIEALRENITGKWSNLTLKWQRCSEEMIACPNIYASESITAACAWAYKDAANGSVLEDQYFNSRLPIVDLRLAQAGVRLAGILNRIFG